MEQSINDVANSITESIDDEHLIIVFKQLKQINVNDPDTQKELGKLIIEDIFKIMKTYNGNLQL